MVSDLLRRFYIWYSDDVKRWWVFVYFLFAYALVVFEHVVWKWHPSFMLFSCWICLTWLLYDACDQKNLCKISQPESPLQLCYIPSIIFNPKSSSNPDSQCSLKSASEKSWMRMIPVVQVINNSPGDLISYLVVQVRVMTCRISTWDLLLHSVFVQV